MFLPLAECDRVAIVDEVDFDAAAAYCWRLHAPKPNVAYARASVDGRRIFLHRFIAERMGIDGPVIDHENRQGLDNTRNNLRPATFGQNNLNRVTRRSSTGCPGVHKSGDGFAVKFTRDGQRHYFGFFQTIEAAIPVATQAAIDLFGDFDAVEVRKQSASARIAYLEAELERARRFA